MPSIPKKIAPVKHAVHRKMGKRSGVPLKVAKEKLGKGQKPMHSNQTKRK